LYRGARNVSKEEKSDSRDYLYVAEEYATTALGRHRQRYGRA